MLRNFIAPSSNTSKIAASYNRIIQISVIAKFVWKKHVRFMANTCFELDQVVHYTGFNGGNFDFVLFILLPLAFSARQKIDLGIKLFFSFPQHKSHVYLVC